MNDSAPENEDFCTYHLEKRIFDLESELGDAYAELNARTAAVKRLTRLVATLYAENDLLLTLCEPPGPRGRARLRRASRLRRLQQSFTSIFF